MSVNVFIKNEKLLKAVSDYPWTVPPIFDQSLALKTSVEVGGPVDCLFTVSDYEELLKLLKIIERNKIPRFVLGKGSNLLVPDEGFRGAAICLKGEFSQITVAEDNGITVGAGVSDFELADFAEKRGLSGAEFLAGIPGTLGGAVYMSASAYGQQMKNITEWVEFGEESGEIRTLDAAELEFSYRHSRFSGKKAIILKAGLKLEPEEVEKIATRTKKMLLAREKNQPGNKRTWGSVFINPPGHSVAKLIESCGLKGKGAGKARVSPKHANFIENTGGATFQDLMETIRMVREAILDKYGIELKTEGKILRQQRASNTKY